MRIQQVGLFTESPPEPLHGRGKIYIGTSGYSFEDWQGPFYPDGLPKSAWLEYYARDFPVVEINTTYYRLPSRSTFNTMAESTPDSFLFWVKLPGDVTHSWDDPHDSIQRFRDAIRPIKDAGKLAGVLGQFPNSFRPSAPAWERLERVVELCDGIEAALEFRHYEWQQLDVRVRAEANRFLTVTADLPQLAGLPSLSSQAPKAGRISYARFHGRNQITWYDRSRGDRYDYEYSMEELNELAALVHKMDEKSGASYIFFNNCHMGQAIRNARMLRDILQSQIAI